MQRKIFPQLEDPSFGHPREWGDDSDLLAERQRGCAAHLVPEFFRSVVKGIPSEGAQRQR